MKQCIIITIYYVYHLILTVVQHDLIYSVVEKGEGEEWEGDKGEKVIKMRERGMEGLIKMRNGKVM